MHSELEFTGERFLPGTPGEIAYEHWHRYAFALRHARGKRVLDAACGEGYGSALLSGVAASVVGIDIDATTVAHASGVYATRPNLRFEAGSVAALPLADGSVDVVVSFETIEHLPAADQPAMLREFARILAPDGLLIISSPNKLRYSDARNYVNPFHVRELYRDELARALSSHFPHLIWYHQTPVLASAIWGEAAGSAGTPGSAEAWVGDGRSVAAMPAPDGIYYVVVAAKAASALPDAEPALSLFADGEETELKRAEHNAGEVLRLDSLLKERTVALDASGAHVRHLEGLIAMRDALVIERDGLLEQSNTHVRHLETLIGERDQLVLVRDGELAAVNAARAEHEAGLIATRDELAARTSELAAVAKAGAALESELIRREAHIGRLEADLRRSDAEVHRLGSAVTAQERIIAYRQSFRWWLRLPWLRLALWYRRMKRQ